MTAPKPPKGLSDEDLAVWARAAADVTPLELEQAAPPPQPRPAPESKTAPPAAKKQKGPRTGARPGAEAAAAPAGKKPPPPDLTLGRRQIRAIKTGRRPIEAELDMHGLFKNQAKRALAQFLETAALSGKKSVLVITGKGAGKNGEPGVLRRMTPEWLKEEPASLYVAGFSAAGQGHGGSGAFYVQLKRPRRRRKPAE